MKTHFISLVLLLTLITACNSTAAIPTSRATIRATSIPSAIPIQISDYALAPEGLSNGCSAEGIGTESPNERVLELRTDGAAYLEATGRIEGWQFRFDCTENPNLIIIVVIKFDSPQGPELTLSREWHKEVWGKIDDGQLEQLADVAGLSENQIVFKDTHGTIGVEFTFQNFYIFVTGTAVEGMDNYEYFADLAAAQLAHISAMMQ